MHTPTLKWLTPAAALAAALAAAAARGDDLPEDLRRALERNVAGVSPIAISWETSYRSDLPTAEAVKLGKFYEASSFFDKRYVDFKRQGSKYSYFRKTWRNYPWKKHQEVRQSNRYDGTSVYLDNADDDPNVIPSVIISGPKMLKKQPAVLFEAEYFDRIGVMMAYTTDTLYKPDRHLVVWLTGRGYRFTRTRLGKAGDAPCLVVELEGKKGRCQVYLDPALDHALRKFVDLTPDGGKRQETTNDEFTHYPDQQVWLPHRSQTVWYTWESMDGKVLKDPLVYETIRVTGLEKKPLPDETFVVDMNRPGMLVSDSRLPGAENQPDGYVAYQVPARPEHLAGVIDAAAQGKKFIPPPPNKRSTNVFIAVNAAVFLSGAVFLLWRYLKR